jgi:hypothetical protein
MSPTRSGLLQRKCGCGGAPGADGTCTECRRKRLEIQGRTADAATVAAVPQAMSEVLRAPGRPLDSETRARFEPRFGHDFSRVRVHTDRAAAESARTVNASAFTVGGDIVFGAGEYAPATAAGQHLLAHELAHTIQQGTAGQSSENDLAVTEPTDPTEQDAASVASTVMSQNAGEVPQALDPASAALARITPDAGANTPAPAATPGPAGQGRQSVPVDLVPVSPEEAKRAEELGIRLPQASKETYRIVGGIGDNAGEPLAAAEKNIITEHLAKAKVATGTPLADPKGTTFVLHDPSGAITGARMKKEVAEGRGPLGMGVAAWIPRTGSAAIARPNFYETRRPTTTEYEKALKSFEKPGDEKLTKVKEKKAAWTKRRDDLFRQVWNAATSAAQATALDDALAGQGLTDREIKEQKVGNKKTGEERVAGAENELKVGSPEKIMTAGSWAVAALCERAGTEGAEAIGAADKVAELKAGCELLTPYYEERNKRVGSIVPIEISQVGIKSDTGDRDTCNPENPNALPIPEPPYTEDQYANVRTVYLRAALIAGTFPTITTHYAIDVGIGDHCDPRCFDLGHLYDTIAATLGHGRGSTYGITPSYGRKSGTNNLWWDETVCHGKHP